MQRVIPTRARKRMDQRGKANLHRQSRRESHGMLWAKPTITT
jgi:hypothetical protein